MRDLWLYNSMERFRFLNYRTKIMAIAFIGTHIPLITLAVYLALKASASWAQFIETMEITLIATLAGTGVTLFVLHHLLHPVALTARTLRTYRRTRDVGTLPTHHTDEVGTLMADASQTLHHLEKALESLENIDGTTGMPNRRKLALDLNKRMTAQARFSACAIRFGSYNRLIEAMDMAAAETAAKEIGERIQAALADGENLYRVGSAEFMFIAAGDPAPLGERMRALIATCAGGLTDLPMPIEPLLYGAVAVFPQDGDTPDMLIDNAVAAVALATDDMRVSFHSPLARRDAAARLQLEQDLRRALARDEFVLHYQPVIDLAVGQAIGAEALIRWHHPQRGMIAPGNFIGAAESSGLIDPIGLWVLRRACAQVHDWNVSGLPGMKVAINLSARQFLDQNLIGLVRAALDESGISADQMEIELTETAAMADPDYTRWVFTKLRDLGVSIAIDDFGTGYAGMSHLRKLPFDKLKIDREFVTDVHKSRDSQAICGALVTLAKGLGLRVLAEGTETEDEVRYLRSRGCDLYQGYYFSRPLSAPDFLRGIAGITQSAKAMTLRTAAQATPSQGYALAS